jgi:hypothetical protein
VYGAFILCCQVSDLNSEQLLALDFLKQVNTVAEKIPGSAAAKVACRNEIRSYMAYFGMPFISLQTRTANTIHSPIFQVIYGDETINLDERFPVLVSSTGPCVWPRIL